MRPWTPDERRTLRRRYPSTPDSELAKLLDRSEDEVREEAERLAVGKDKARFKGRPMPRWTPGEVQRLVDLYDGHSNAEIARLLGRTEASVMAKGSRMGLTKSDLRRAIAGAENVRSRRVNPPREDAD